MSGSTVVDATVVEDPDRGSMVDAVMYVSVVVWFDVDDEDWLDAEVDTEVDDCCWVVVDEDGDCVVVVVWTVAFRKEDR